MAGRFTYLFDPLCGWCYGAAPAIRILRALPGVTLRAQPVGMFAWERAIPLERMRDHIRPADSRIASLTGQVFSEAYFERVIGDPDGVVDSGPATLVLFLAERQAPGSSLDLLADIQTARYVDGRDVTDAGVLREIATRHGVDASDETALPAARQWADEGAGILAQAGARGVPTLLQDSESGSRVVPSDYLYQAHNRLADLAQTR